MKTAILGFAPSYRPGVVALNQQNANPVCPARSLRSVLSIKPADFRLFHAWRP